MAIADTDPQGSGLAWYERRGALLVGPDVVGITLREVRNAVSSAKPQYDLLLLDTPGQMTASNDALALADLALIPCRPTIADAVPRMHATANGIAKSTAFVITQVPPRGERRAHAVRSSLAKRGTVCPIRMTSKTAILVEIAEKPARRGRSRPPRRVGRGWGTRSCWALVSGRPRIPGSMPFSSLDHNHLPGLQLYWLGPAYASSLALVIAGSVEAREREPRSSAPLATRLEAARECLPRAPLVLCLVV